MSDRTAKKATIKRATKVAHQSMNKLDADILSQLTELYRAAADGINELVDQHADSENSIGLDALNSLLTVSESLLRKLESQRNDLLSSGLQSAVRIGIEPFIEAKVAEIETLQTIASQAVKFVESFVGGDGLQLSDRIWRLDNHAGQIVRDAVNQAVIQGSSASRAAQELLSRGQPVSQALQDKIKANKAGGIKSRIAEELLAGNGSPHANALRVFRTEINRAHSEAYEESAFTDAEVIGTRFLLSPNHPRRDICDMHAHANLYGLGPGVYPKGKNPLPAHPNTLSYKEVVFRDEITAKDRTGKQTPIEWLNGQSVAVQAAVLNSRKKRVALQKGLLPANAIATPWAALKPRFERQGHDTDLWG